MAVKTFTHKIPNGKLVRVFVEIEKEIISSVKITGDFFIHPEESIFEIEKALAGCKITIGEEELIGLIEDAVEKTGAELVGIDAKGIAFAILGAVGA